MPHYVLWACVVDSLGALPTELLGQFSWKATNLINRSLVSFICIPGFPSTLSLSSPVISLVTMLCILSQLSCPGSSVIRAAIESHTGQSLFHRECIVAMPSLSCIEYCITITNWKLTNVCWAFVYVHVHLPRRQPDQTISWSFFPFCFCSDALHLPFLPSVLPRSPPVILHGQLCPRHSCVQEHSTEKMLHGSAAILQLLNHMYTCI